MTKHASDLVEQHILEHESRLKHIDELLERSQKAEYGESDQELATELKDLTRDRDTLHGHLQDLMGTAEIEAKDMLEKTGPMGLWDTVAQRLEKLVERIEGKKGSE